MKSAIHKKERSALCYWCEYKVCRKGHKCSWYKQWVKRYKKNQRKTKDYSLSQLEI